MKIKNKTQNIMRNYSQYIRKGGEWYSCLVYVKSFIGGNKRYGQ